STITTASSQLSLSSNISQSPFSPSSSTNYPELIPPLTRSISAPPLSTDHKTTDPVHMPRPQSEPHNMNTLDKKTIPIQPESKKDKLSPNNDDDPMVDLKYIPEEQQPTTLPIFEQNSAFFTIQNEENQSTSDNY